MRPALALVVLAACDAEVPRDALPVDEVTAEIDDDGGVLALRDARLVVPPEAVPDGTEITLVRVGPAPDAYPGATTDLFAIEPEWLTFARPARLALAETHAAPDAVPMVQPDPVPHWSVGQGYSATRPSASGLGSVVLETSVGGRVFVAPLGPQTLSVPVSYRHDIDLLVSLDGRPDAPDARRRFADALVAVMHRLDEAGLRFRMAVMPADADTELAGRLLQRDNGSKAYVYTATDAGETRLREWIDTAATRPGSAIPWASQQVWESVDEDVYQANRSFLGQRQMRAFVWMAGADATHPWNPTPDAFEAWAAETFSWTDVLTAWAVLPPDGGTGCREALSPAPTLTATVERLDGSIADLCSDGWTDHALDWLDALPALGRVRLTYDLAGPVDDVVVRLPNGGVLPSDGYEVVREPDGGVFLTLNVAGMAFVGTTPEVFVTFTPR